MNTGYSHHPQHPQQPPQQGNPSGPGMSGHPPPQYYPMGHYPPGYGYPYPQPMVMYQQPPPRQSVPPDTPHPNPSPAMASAGTKRKRKSETGRGKGADKGSDDDTAASGSDVPRVQTTQQQQTIVDLKKRTKTVCHLFFQSDFMNGSFNERTSFFFSNVLAIRVVVVK